MDIRSIKGIGEKRAELLHRMGLYTVADVVYDFPHRYRDRSRLTELFFEVPEGEVLFRARVLRKYLSKSALFLDVGTELVRLRVIFFNARFLYQKFTVGEEYYFFGSVSDGAVANPEFAHSSSEEFLRLVPVYRLTEGLSQTAAEQFHAGALDLARLQEFPENLPAFLLEGEDALMARGEAIAVLHRPRSFEEVGKARRRIVVEELFWIFLGILLRRSDKPVTPIKASRSVTDCLPLRLTRSQRSAIADIQRDLESGRLMNRLVNGDVGCGKSVVAYVAAKMVADAGMQVLFMAPTAVLAEQLYRGYLDCFRGEKCGFELNFAAILTSRLGAAERQDVYAMCRSGDIKVLFGTHAVLSDNLSFKNLSLVITDEQQRFGIFQRQRALDKAETAHNLYLTATPIPRTLALTFFADMDISRIDEMPSGRKPVITRFIGDADFAKMIAFVQSRIDSGEQAYFVVPSIESGSANLVSIEKKLKKLLRAKIVTAHGNMKAEDAQRSFDDFRRREADVLLATTMIEVGIDNPNATIMVVVEADRFGLSQLHQLRGRVGRGGAVSHCFLLSRSGINERLEVLLESNSGFEISEMDLKMRGPGMFLGEKQSGSLKISFDFGEDDVLFARDAALRARQMFRSGDAEMEALVGKYKKTQGEMSKNS